MLGTQCSIGARARQLFSDPQHKPGEKTSPVQCVLLCTQSTPVAAFRLSMMMVELTQTLLHHDLSAHMTHISIRSQASVTGNRKTPALAVNPTSNHPTSKSQAI